MGQPSRLASGHLTVGDIYVIVHVNPLTSLQRRRGRLTPDHPWTNPATLRRLCRFYQDPSTVIGGPLGQTLAQACWHHLQNPEPEALVSHLRDLAEKP